MAKRRSSRHGAPTQREVEDSIDAKLAEMFAEAEAVRISVLISRLLGEESSFPPPENDGKIYVPARPGVRAKGASGNDQG